MKKLNEAATRLFCQLLQKLNNEEYLKLTVKEFMPLCIEKIGSDIGTDEGNATLYSLSHYYEQNGDLLRDPEVTFIVIDNRSHPKDYTNIIIYPASYRQDNVGMNDESIRIEGNRITSFIKTWQYEHCHFATQWLKNIKQQGYLI